MKNDTLKNGISHIGLYGSPPPVRVKLFNCLPPLVTDFLALAMLDSLTGIAS